MKIDAGNLYVSHGGRIHVVNLSTEKQIAEIDSLKGVQGIVIVKTLNKD